MKSEMYSTCAPQYSLAIEENIYNACLERPSLNALIGDVKGKDVIDLGCGPGIYAAQFISQGAKSVTCLDLHDEMIALVREKLGNKVNAYSQDLSQGLPHEKSNHADLIVCPLVLHYIEHLSPFFEEIHRVLKPGGRFAFSTHHPFADFQDSAHGNYFKRELITQDWNTIGKPICVSFYRRSLTEFCKAITDAGLVITKISEGEVREKAKDISETTYEYLKKNPHFIFIACQKQPSI